jgi:parallel beta-helix repeat protein
MAFIRVKAGGRSFGTARWYPINVTTSPLCSGGCSIVTGNTVFKNHVMGIYIRNGSTRISTYLATVSSR